MPLARFIFLLFSTTTLALAQPKLVNGIALYVNEEPATLFELYRTAHDANVSQEEAIKLLVNKKLHQQEIAKYEVSVSNVEVEAEIKKIAQKNQLQLSDFRALIAKEGMRWNDYMARIREDMVQDRLYRKIASNSLRMAEEQELKDYYEKNRAQFLIPKSIKTIKYASKNRAALESYLKNPSLPRPTGIQVSPETLNPETLNPRLAALFAETEDNAFTQIFTLGDTHVAFLVQAREGDEFVPFAKVRDGIFAKLMGEREERIIKEHFEKLRAVANVRILRLD